MSKEATCSFCGKSASDVAGMIEGPALVNVCNECIGLCQDIVAEETERENERPNRAPIEPPATAAGNDRGAVVVITAGTSSLDREAWTALEPHLARGLRIAYTLKIPTYDRDKPTIMMFLDRGAP